MNPSPEPVQVWLVEDSADDVFFFKRALDKCDVPAVLRIAEDGAKAIHLLSEPGGVIPQLMFLDLKMPNVNGFEVLEWLGQQPFRSSVRVVVLTSSEEPREVQIALSLGAAEFLTKPVSPARLREQILRVTPSVVASS